MRRAFLLVATAVAGCHRAEPVELPSTPEDAISGVLAITANGRHAARGFSLPGRPPAVAADDGADVVVMYFDRSLDALELVEGPIELADGPDARPFPATVGLHYGRLTAGAVAFEEADATHPAVERLGRPPVPLDVCLERGCYARPEDIAPRVCTSPCPRAEPEPPVAPNPVRPPDLSSCPDGWAATEGRCVPPARATCAAHEAQWLGASGCVRVGGACPPAGAWSADLPAGNVVYVREGAMGGDGTMGSPYGSIAFAIAQSSGARVIALAAGTYAENVVLPDGVTLFGACVESTFVAAPNAVTIAATGGVTIANLTVRGVRTAIETLATLPGNRLALRDLAIEQTSSGGIVRGIGPVEVDVERVVVRGGGEAAFLFGARSQATLTDVAVEVRGRDVWATGLGTEVTLTRVAMIESGAGGDPCGVDASEQGLVRGEVVSFEGQSGPAVRARALGVVELADVFAGDTRGDAVQVIGGGIVRLERASIEGTGGAALDVETATASFTDVSIRAPTYYGPALDMRSAAKVTFDRVRVEGARGAGLAAFGVATHVVASDLAVVDTLPRTRVPDGTGVGIGFYSGAMFELARVLVDGAPAIGLQIVGDTEGQGPVTRGRVEDLEIQRIGPRTDLDAYGLYFRGRSDADAVRVRLTEIDNFGVQVWGGAIARLEDVFVDDAFMGVRTDNLANAELTRVEIHRTRGGALCIKGDSTAVARDVTISDLVGTRSTDDGKAFCAIGVPVAASGIVVNNLASLAIERYSVANTPGIGMSLRGRTGVTAIDGAFADAALAVQLAPELPLGEVLVRTTFAGTGVRLDVQ